MSILNLLLTSTSLPNDKQSGRIAHSYLLKRGDQPKCIGCDTSFTIKTLSLRMNALTLQQSEFHFLS